MAQAENTPTPEPVTVTELENQFLYWLACSDHSGDGNGLVVYLDESYFNIPMRQVRAVAVTLQKKGVIGVEPAGFGMPGHACVLPEFMVEDESVHGFFRIVNVTPAVEQFPR